MQPAETPRFTLRELVEASGLPERTIRFYISEGLVAPALGRGRARYFTPDHLRQIELVRRLRQQKLSLEEIRQRMTATAAQTHPVLGGEPWQRLALHAGLELHVRADAPESVAAFAREVMALADRWFGEQGWEASGSDVVQTETGAPYN